MKKLIVLIIIAVALLFSGCIPVAPDYPECPDCICAECPDCICPAGSSCSCSTCPDCNCSACPECECECGCPEGGAPIIINGILSPSEWDCATVIALEAERNGPSSSMGDVRVLVTTDYLYVAFDIADVNDARTQYTNEVGNDQISINVNPTDGGPSGFPYDLIFETSALSYTCVGCPTCPDDGGHHWLPWNPKVNSGTSDDNWATRWFPNDAQETLPIDLESATEYSGGRRITEWKLPLVSTPGDVVKVGGAVDVGDGNSYVYPVGLLWDVESTYVDIVVY